MVLKWFRASKKYKCFEGPCGISTDVDYYKACRPSQIFKSEELVDRIVTVLSEDYINPFRIEIDQTKLMNPSSGSPVSNELADEILFIPENSRKLYSESGPATVIMPRG